MASGVPLVEFDIHGSKAHATIRMGGPLREQFAPSLYTQSAPFSRSEKSLLLASFQGSLSFLVAAEQMRRPSGPCGGSARQGVSAATDLDASSEKDADYGSWVARRRAQKKRWEKNEGGWRCEKKKNKVKGDGRASD